MLTKRMLLLPLSICCLAGWTTRGFAADWPQWGGHDGRNMASEEEGLPAWFEPGKKKPDCSGIDLQTTKNVRWVARLGTETYSSPVIAGGRVYIGTNDATLDDPRYKPNGGGVLLCLDEATGKLLWRLVVPKLETEREKVSDEFDTLGLGICSSPAVDGDRVYVVTNRCEVLCLDVHGLSDGNQGPFKDEAHYAAAAGQPSVELQSTDADIIWRYDILNEAPSYPHDASSGSVLVHGDLLYVTTGNGTNEGKVPLPTAPSLIVLDKNTGRLVAKDDGRISSRVYHGQWSSPSLGTVHDRSLLFYGGGDGVCYAFEAPAEAPASTAILKQVWSFDCNPPHFRWKDGKPIAYKDGDYRVNEEDTADGTFYAPCEIIGTPVFHNDRVYVAIGRDPLHGRGRGILHCIDATKTGDVTNKAKVWSYEGVDRSLSTVAIANGLLFAADYAGRLHCLDAETGQCYWVHEGDENMWSSPLVADGKVYLGTRKCLWVLAAAKEKKVLSQIRLGSPIRATPVAANGALYIASQRYLWAVCEQGAMAVGARADNGGRLQTRRSQGSRTSSR